MAAPDVVEPRPVSAEGPEQVRLPAPASEAAPGPVLGAQPEPQVSEQPPLLVTKAGAAADRAEFSQIVDTATPPRRLEFVDKRSAVVLYVADSEVQPTRECVSTVAAISQATGRVAVGLIGNGEYAEAWRQEIDSTIPMGEDGQNPGSAGRRPAQKLGGNTECAPGSKCASSAGTGAIARSRGGDAIAAEDAVGS